MQAVVKTHHTEIKINGKISSTVLEALAKEYGNKLKIINDEGEELVLARQTDWFEEVDKSLSPGKILCIYRENANLTQTELGEKLGGISKQNISDMENDRKPISIKVAKKLANIFNKPVERFLDL